MLYENQGTNKEISKIKNMSIDFYSSKDTCLNIVYLYSDTEIFKHKKRLKHLKLNFDCIKNKYPIPNFVFETIYYNEYTKCHLMEDFNIYVLEAKKGLFVKEQEICENIMPNEWKHGYSKGAAISEEKKVIIYWVVVW